MPRRSASRSRSYSAKAIIASCERGSCLGGTPLTCTAGNPCTTDTRAPASGCGGGETCASCAADCGACDEAPAPLALTLLADGGGRSNVAGLTDDNLVDKVSTALAPACLEYALAAPSTVTGARLLEDNAGAWSVTLTGDQVRAGTAWCR